MARTAQVLLALLLAVMTASPALAHKLKVFATAIGSAVEGRVYFVGGGAGTGVPVELRNSSGEVVATARTASPDGRFALTLPYRDDFTVFADAQDGHVGSFVLQASRLAEALQARPGADLAAPEPVTAVPVPQTADASAASTAAVEAAVARQLAPLREEIDALRSAVGFRDMLGGVGFILGGFGLWAFLVARRGRK